MNEATRKKYLARITATEARGTDSTLYHIGDLFLIEAHRCTHDLNSRRDLMNIWKKSGYISKALPSHIAIDTRAAAGAITTLP